MMFRLLHLLVVVLWSVFVSQVGAQTVEFDRDSFQQVILVESAGKIIDTGAFGGHSAPVVVDLNEDGLHDLVIGNFAGQFQFFRNEGNAKNVVFTDGGLLRASGADIKVYIYCCIGAQPRFADFNGDEVLDLITNNYDPGHCQVFLGIGDGGFSESFEVKGSDGIAVKAEPSQKEDYESFGSFFESVDWDDDGDLDLLIGCFDGTLKIRINEGSKRKPQFVSTNQSVRAGQAELRVKAHCCPVVADWDADGLWDIISGSEDGSVTWFRNTGTRGKPVFANGKRLIQPSNDLGGLRVVLEPTDIRPGIRSQVAVADINGDGRVDLLVGDYSTAFDLRSDLSSNEKESVRSLVGRFHAKRDDFYKAISEIEQDLQKRYPGKEVSSRAAKAEYALAFDAHMESPKGVQFIEDEKVFYQNLRPFMVSNKRDTLDERNATKSHGYVWVYLRK